MLDTKLNVCLDIRKIFLVKEMLIRIIVEIILVYNSADETVNCTVQERVILLLLF